MEMIEIPKLNLLNAVLNNLINLQIGIEACVIISKDGIIVTSIMDEFGEESIGNITHLIRYITDIVQFDSQIQFEKGIKSITTQNKSFIFRQVSNDFMFVVICHEQADMKIVKVYSEYVAGKIEKLFLNIEVDSEIPSLKDIKEEKETGREFIFKICIIGEGSVGKTTLVKQFSQSVFESEYKSTIGVSIIKNDYKVDGDRVHFQLWDIAGQERWANMRRVYYAGSQGAIIVYDVTNPASFHMIDKWVNEFKEYNSNVLVKYMIVGNKMDLGDQRKVLTEEGKNKAKLHDCIFIETSAKTAENVEDAFKQIARLLIKDY
ncbi:MAG: GTP-binding protein [Candidatus Lokiarchaeota archaeon]|nr:GTP-binding protein [Candidatus Lokiarchaeota archaeon]